MDNLSREDRRKNMRNIRSKGTKPEITLINELRKNKLKFETHISDIVGKPDIIFRRKKIAVFIDSDFWHGHPKRFIMPKSNKKYWQNKIKRNIIRDKYVTNKLRREGWSVLRIWEFDIKHNLDKCINRIVRKYKEK